LDDVLRGMAVLEFYCGWMDGKVYSSLLDIAIQCIIEDGLKFCGGRCQAGHERGGRRGSTAS